MEAERIGRLAAHFVKKAQAVGKGTASVHRSMPTQEQTNRFARTAGMFTKHVVGSTVKPIHSLWHEVLAFVFIVFAGLGAWKLYNNPGKLEPAQFLIALVFVVVVASYGVSSLLKSRQIKKNSR